MSGQRISRRKITTIAAAGVLFSPTLRAQPNWRPKQPITIYQPFAAGGTTDVHLRFLGERASKMLGQPVIVVAKPGAAGTFAASQLLTAKPDGYTLACMTINSLHYPYYQETSWDPIRDFTYIIGLADFTQAVVVPADAPWKTIEDFIAAGKREPEKYTYGTSGVGGSGHLVGIEIEQATGAKFTQVPYKGSAEWLFALLSGQISSVIGSGYWGETVNAGKARLLAVVSDRRYAKYPDVPTLIERGIAVSRISPYGIVGPKGMPDEIVNALHEAFKEGMSDPGYEDMLGRFVVAPWYRSPADFRSFFEKYWEEAGPIIKRTGLSKSQ